MLDSLSRNRDIAAVTLLYAVGWTAVGIRNGASIALPYLVEIIFLGGVILAFDSKRPLDRNLLWAFSGWGFIHMPGGLTYVDGDVLYEYWVLPFLRYDHIVHILGFAVVGLAVANVNRRWLPVDAPRVAGAVVFFGAMGIGAANEVVEFIIGESFPSTNVGDATNLGLDLVANAIGGGWAAIVTTRRLRQPAQEGVDEKT